MLTDDEKEFYEKISQIEHKGFQKGILAGFFMAMAIAILVAIIL